MFAKHKIKHIMKKLLLSFGLLSLLTSCTIETESKFVNPDHVQSFNFSTTINKYIGGTDTIVNERKNHWIYDSKTNNLVNEDITNDKEYTYKAYDIGSDKLEYLYIEEKDTAHIVFDCSEVSKSKLTVTISSKDSDTSTNIFYN